jgi:hypothetical protein
VVQVVVVVVRRKKCVVYVGRLLRILVNQSDAQGSREELVASQWELRVFQEQTFSLQTVIDDQVDGCK